MHALRPIFFGVLAMAIVVAVSNVAVGYPINDWITWGALTYPVAFLVTDVMNRSFGASNARKVVYGGFLVGVVFSIWLADIRIALASGTAFLTAQLIDIFVFNKVSQKTWWQAPFISSSLSSAIDTVLFFSIAFIGSGLPWVTWAAGDYAIKLAMAILLLVPFKLVISIITNPATVVPRDTTPKKWMSTYLITNYPQILLHKHR